MSLGGSPYHTHQVLHHVFARGRRNDAEAREEEEKEEKKIQNARPRQTHKSSVSDTHSLSDTPLHDVRVGVEPVLRRR